MKIEFTTENAAFSEECGGSLEYETIIEKDDIYD